MRVETAGGCAALRKLIVLELSADQRNAVEAPYDGCFAVVGKAGTGKTTALAHRIAHLETLEPAARPLRFDSPAAIERYAVGLLRSHGVEVTHIDDVEAALRFTDACQPLLALEWSEFVSGELDPEVAALRSPDRFLQAAFRLICRLRDAAVAPAAFLSRALAGATEFYAKPPNLADPALLCATKRAHHDSLAATPQELLRQHRREVDLAKILAKLYARYAGMTRDSGVMTGRDAAVAATQLLRTKSDIAATLRSAHRFAFVDDAQELTNAQLELLATVFGDALRGVTLCGDPSAVVGTTRMVQPRAVFARADSKVELSEEHRKPRRELQRCPTPAAEAQAIAQRVDLWLAEGFAPERIAVLFRSVRNVEPYEAALLERNIPAVVTGDVNVFADRRALDALALLYNVNDPFRHDWLLRSLSNPATALCDASLAILCSDPPDPQRSLFTLDDEPPPTARSARWHPKRDLRLGWNVIAGERDDALSDDAAARVRRFRRLREGWLTVLRDEPFETFVATVWREGLARDGAPGSARARAQQVVLRRLFDRLSEFVARNATTTLGDVLDDAQRRIGSEVEACERAGDHAGFVRLSSVESAIGREFDCVVVASVHPGAFPRWYSPEAFLFSARFGMIPKENAGDAPSARTAKFSYYTAAVEAAQQYYRRERGALVYALRRACRNVLVTAHGAPTRGMTAPEFMEELRQGKL